MGSRTRAAVCLPDRAYLATLPRFANQVLTNEVFVQCHAQAWPDRHFHPAVNRLHPLIRQLMAKRRIFDAILEQKRIAAGSEPMNTRRDGDRTRVTMIAKPRTRLFHPRANIG